MPTIFGGHRGSANSTPVPSSFSGFRRRRLQLECLDSRHALSSIVGLESEPCPDVGAEVASERAATVIDPATAEVQAAPGEFVGPLEADAYFAAVDAAPSIQAEGEAAGAPEIDRFEVEDGPLFLFITGHVTDDQLPEVGCIIRFGGLLEGQITATLPDGSFFYYTILPPGASGTITAVAVDSLGLVSPIVSIEV